MKTLYLFDIDGTLVNINKLHLASYKYDYYDVMKINVPDYMITKTFGMPDSSMHRQIFRELSINYDNAVAQRLMQLHPSNFAKVLGQHPVEPLEGVLDFLEAIRSAGHFAGVVSGNMEGIARLILEKSGLSKYFDVSSFDDGLSTRAQIVQRAIERAKSMKYDFGKIIVIGDTAYDIEAAKKSGAFAVGVATGSCTLQELQKTADLTLSSLKEYGKIKEMANS
ncbi:MAG: HAD family hydrolase [Nanoarchaeota archaeon]